MFMARLRQSRRHKGVREVRSTAPIIISLCIASNMVAEALRDANAKFMTSRVACCITVLSSARVSIATLGSRVPRRKSPVHIPGRDSLPWVSPHMGARYE